MIALGLLAIAAALVAAAALNVLAVEQGDEVRQVLRVALLLWLGCTATGVVFAVVDLLANG